MKRSLFLSIAIGCIVLTSFVNPSTLKGTWQFNGGVYNGKPDTASLQYTMRRIYTDHDFNAFASQKGYKTERYEAGNYVVKGDTCFETQTYSSQPSQATGKTIAYIITFKKDEFILSGTLPSGMVVEEHWSRVILHKKR